MGLVLLLVSTLTPLSFGAMIAVLMAVVAAAYNHGTLRVPATRFRV